MMLGKLLFTLLISEALASPHRVESIDINIVLSSSDSKTEKVPAIRRLVSHHGNQAILRQYQSRTQGISLYELPGFVGFQVTNFFPLPENTSGSYKKSCVDTDWPQVLLVGSLIWLPSYEFEEPRTCRFFPAKGCTGDAGFATVGNEEDLLNLGFPLNFQSGYCYYTAQGPDTS